MNGCEKLLLECAGFAGARLPDGAAAGLGAAAADYPWRVRLAIQ